MFELSPFMNSWEDSSGKSGPDGKLKFPVTFHDEMNPVEEIQDLLSLNPPKKKENKTKVVELGKKNKNKKGLF